MFVCCCVSLCVISRVYTRCGPAYRRILLTRSLNNNNNTAPLTLDQVLVGQWRSLFQLPQNSNASTMHLNTPRFQTSTPMSAQMAQDVKIITVPAETSKKHLRHALRRVYDRALGL